MKSEHVLYQMFLQSLDCFQVCRKNYFTILKADTNLLLLEILTADISLQWELEENSQLENNHSANGNLTRRFYTHFSQTLIVLKSKFRDGCIPHSFRKAYQYPLRAEAIDREFNAAFERGTWIYAGQISEMNPLPFPWTFRIKDASAKSGILYKACCRLCGNHRKAFRDFDPENTYVSVVRHEIICIFSAKVVAQNLKFEEVDIDNTYPYGNLDKPINKKQPSESAGKNSILEKFCLIVKFLYDGRQVGEIWGTLIHKKLMEWKFVQSTQE